MFSIIIPLYNKAEYIVETIKSVLNQSFTDFEVIIVDDASTDGSLHLAEKIKDSRIRIFTKANEGVSAARNFGISKATRPILAFLDADDKWEPDYLKIVLQMIKTYPDATDVWEHTKDLDARIGMCLDVGHDLRNGCDPVADLRKYHTRVFDMHIKDVDGASKAGKAIELGRGLIDFPALVKMMRKVNYTGMCSLEYEKDMKDPFLGIAESIGYFKAVSELI